MGIELTGLVVSLIAALASAVTSIAKESSWVDAIAQAIVKLGQRTIVGIPENEPSSPTVSLHLSTRLEEVKRVYRREKRNEGLSNFANGLLVLGQYVVGAVLATTFIRENLDALITGLLGLSVVITTTLHQKFRPDLSAKISASKASFLYSTIIKVEDGIEKIRKAHPNAPAEEDIINMLSRTLIKWHDNKEWIPMETEKLIGESEKRTGESEKTSA